MIVNEYVLIGLGFLGQAMFGARTIAQWIISEKEGRVVSPTIFWVFSLIGATIFLFYGIIRHDFVIILGQTVSYYIYLRNLYLKGVWNNMHFAVRYNLICIPVFVLAFVPDNSVSQIFKQTHFTDLLLVVGMTGQLLLNCRYLYQWYYSEKAQESILPLGFWIISAVASVMVIIYGIYRDDIVLLVAQSGGLVAYARNIFIHFRPRPLNEAR